MERIRAHKFWLRPTKEQEAGLERWSEASRIIWNRTLGKQVDYPKIALAAMAGGALPPERPPVAYLPTTYWLKSWREEDDFLRDFPQKAAEATLKRLAESWQRFFDFRKNPGKYPALASAKARRAARGRSVEDFGRPKFRRFGEPAPLIFRDSVAIRANQVKIPKLGWIRCKTDYVPMGIVKNVIIRKTPKRWMVSVQTSEEVPDPVHPHADDAVGIDVGVRQAVTLSNGTISHPAPRILAEYERLERRRLRLQRGLARKREGAKKENRKVGVNYRKELARLSRVSENIANIRVNWLHRESKRITDEYGLVAVEKLAVANMTASAKGSEEIPGVNVRAKAGLNRSLLAVGLSEFRRQLTYKTEWKGGQLVEVNPAHTSQTCSRCGHVSPENRKTTENFRCVVCGHAEDADVNAAKNILAVAQTVSAEGDTGSIGRQARRQGQPCRESTRTLELRTENHHAYAGLREPQAKGENRPVSNAEKLASDGGSRKPPSG